MATTVRKSFCRVCHNACPIQVEIDGGRAVKVRADASPTHGGYTCARGRALPDIENSGSRLLHSMKRTADGSHVPIETSRAIAEIADRLGSLIAEHGPRSVAWYGGTKLSPNPLSEPMSMAFMDAIGSPMRFTANTIDKPGKVIAKGLHGSWLAPTHGFDEPDVALYLGANGLVSLAGTPHGSPGRFIAEFRARGGRLIVIDPRRTALAARATVHLQARAGHDAAILAALLNVILAEGWEDAEFLRENVSGVDELRRVVAPFTPQAVGDRAGVDAADLVAAARIFAQARRGFAVAGTGPNMGAGNGTLVEYLVLVLDTVCGHYARAGDRVRNPGTLIPRVPAKAQASPPRPAFGIGERIRVRGLSNSLAGMPTAALPEEILTPGEGRVRALIVLGGNPAVVWPDQVLTLEALRDLELLVTLDVEMSQTSQLAHYVMASQMSLEVPGYTLLSDLLLFYGNASSGFVDAAAQYTPALVEPPPGSDVIEEWRFFHELAKEMGLALNLRAGASFMPGSPPPTPLDMTATPTGDEMLEILAAGSRVPLAEIKANDSVALYPDETCVVAPKDEDWPHRLCIGDETMLAELEALAPGRWRDTDAAFEFRLLSRRLDHMLNSSYNIPATNRGKNINLAYFNPDDLARLGLADGARIELVSARASIPGIVATEPGLRSGYISMAHGFGGVHDTEAEFASAGSATTRLLSATEVFDRYSGQPLMSNVPVNVRVTG
ncbi:molybdopterin-dependent oxidoreductase [Amycolatopsis sp. GM8]|uniref:molybdopterin-containing oxidoreductase family protein n=1 Tax=Amycolatopsis sp. GM8 TaxID=2896530 RepID=UPI001F431AE9|nr:molybdopterin-dependent oxidoreductase [Amycolatopsis sp. GM8]